MKLMMHPVLSSLPTMQGGGAHSGRVCGRCLGPMLRLFMYLGQAYLPAPSCPPPPTHTHINPFRCLMRRWPQAPTCRPSILPHCCDVNDAYQHLEHHAAAKVHKGAYCAPSGTHTRLAWALPAARACAAAWLPATMQQAYRWCQAHWLLWLQCHGHGDGNADLE
jgi:hypothetical protein